VTTLAEQLEELGKELKKLANVRGRWMKNVWFEAALLASLVLILSSLAVWAICPSPSPTPILPSTETPLQRTIYPDMHQDYP